MPLVSVVQAGSWFGAACWRCRLGRLAHDLITLIDGLEKRGIGFKAINSPMDTTTPAGRTFLQIQEGKIKGSIRVDC